MELLSCQAGLKHATLGASITQRKCASLRARKGGAGVGLTRTGTRGVHLPPWPLPRNLKFFTRCAWMAQRKPAAIHNRTHRDLHRPRPLGFGDEQVKKRSPKCTERSSIRNSATLKRQLSSSSFTA